MIRTIHNRNITDNKEKILKKLENSASCGAYSIDILRGKKRKARTAVMEVKYESVKITPPKEKQNTYSPITVNIISAEEKSCSNISSSNKIS